MVSGPWPTRPTARLRLPSGRTRCLSGIVMLPGMPSGATRESALLGCLAPEDDADCMGDPQHSHRLGVHRNGTT